MLQSTLISMIRLRVPSRRTRVLRGNWVSWLSVAVLAVLGVGAGSATAGDMQPDIDQALFILKKFREIPEDSIPDAVLKNAHGIAFLTVTKAGFLFSGRGGSGVVLARTGDGWSGPSAIGTGGIGFGFQAGAKVTEFVIILNSPKAVEAFSKGGNLTVGGQISAAVGPLGRTASADLAPQSPMYTYSRSQGIFGGVSLEGTAIVERTETNAEFYGRPVKPYDLLSGKVDPPKGTAKLRAALSEF
jgi:lipid-binding SYLF domain-containing protein